MNIPDIASLQINGTPFVLEDKQGNDERYFEKFKNYAKSLPYQIESHEEMMKLFDFILLRITQCVEAKDFDVGLVQWDSMITYFAMLKYPIPKEKRIQLAKIYFHLATLPGMSTQRVASCADTFCVLTRSMKKLSVKDLRLPWRPIYDILSADLFLRRRQFEYTQLSWCMGYMAENSRRFFHPAAIEEMLSVFVPQINYSLLDSILAAQYYLLTFLPLSHPQSYLPMLFRMWESINSAHYDERMLQFLSKLSEMHAAPDISDPTIIPSIPDDARSPDEGRPKWQDEFKQTDRWDGIYKDVGIFTEYEWGTIMCKCLSSMKIPLADGGSITTGTQADSQIGFEIDRLPKPQWKIMSLARIIVYSMASDGRPAPPSTAPTPSLTPLASGANTPRIETISLKEYLAFPLGKKPSIAKGRSYLAGSKALDSLVRLIASTESFFHPSSPWAADLSAFIKYIVYEFNKRWHEERQPDCKTPTNRQLSRVMKRELVKSLRTVVLLAMFSQDSTTVSNIQSCLKSMSVMEPDMILHPILERAVPSLEALVETQRTLAVMKALGAVAPSIVSRQVYYPGAKHLVPLLELLIPGIDLNDPSKTLCTTTFLTEISQYIKFGDITRRGDDADAASIDTVPAIPSKTHLSLPSFDADDWIVDMEPRLSDADEDMLLKDTTGSFADWIANFIRRVIQLLENLPEEGRNSGGSTEVQVVDAVTGVCSQICVHLSDELFDLVLKLIYDYASTNVRSNAVRAIHQLVECVANANPIKTLDKFLPFATRNIRFELENGASSTRTTSSSSPLPSDATLHWNLAILRGTVYNDGRAIIAHKNDFLSILTLLHKKTLSKRGFSWTGKVLSSMLLTLTHTYPLENKFVNPDEWASEEFRWNHHKHWGKLYKPDEITISWHIPSDAEIDFAIQVFRELVEPVIGILEGLISPDVPRDAVWRNNFCRHLTLVRNAWSGIPTFVKEHVSEEELAKAAETSDILGEIPEMIASMPSVESAFCLTEKSDPRYCYMMSLRKRFGEFLHNASVSLQRQGEENTVDAVHILVRSIRTFMLDYGDSRDSYYVNEEQYTSERNIARQYAKQKVWPRSVYVRRARFCHSARMRWNSIDRMRGPLQDLLIDDLTEWAMWHYPVIREYSQNVIDSISTCYDGVRKRTLSKLYKAIEPGTDDDRMKGALWTLNYPSLGKYAISEPTLAPELLLKLLDCQHNQKPSIQDCVTAVSDNCINSFVEPSYLVFEVPSDALDFATDQMKKLLAAGDTAVIVDRCRKRRIARIKEMNDAADMLTAALIDRGESPSIHWRYAIVVSRCLRTLFRRDVPTTTDHIGFMLERMHDSHPSIRYYAQRGVMKSLRNIKLRSNCPTVRDLELARHKNPLKEVVSIPAGPTSVQDFVQAFKIPFNFDEPSRPPIYFDKRLRGFVPLSEKVTLFRPPDKSKSTFQPWDPASRDAVATVRERVLDPDFWHKLGLYFGEENLETSIVQDNVSCVKSIFQLLEDEPWPALQPTLETLLKQKDKDDQRAAAEFLAGVIGGSKHWPTDKQKTLWAWIKPYLHTMFRKNLKTDTLSIWTSFLEYVFYCKDPRRVQPLVDYLFDEFFSLDFNAELSFDVVRKLSLFRALYEELGCAFIPWADEVMERCWAEIHSEHEEVRTYIGEIMAFTERISILPRPSLPITQLFVRECRILPNNVDIMGMRGTYHKKRIDELVESFPVWRQERLPGVRAFQSKYDRVGVTICKWLYQVVHDIHAIGVFDYILPLMPELFRFTELSDNDELATRSSNMLVRMCGVMPPRSLVHPILQTIFDTIRVSPSWRVRLKALPLLQIFYFRNVPCISEAKVNEILEVLCKCLDDEVVEVREMAATTLSGILRLSPRRSVITYRDRFKRLAKNSHIPDRASPGYNKAIRERHAAVLGICALIDSFPYTVERWMPDLLASVLAEHTYDPTPISTTVRKCARNFKKTHQDTWHEDSKKFNEEQLSALSTLLTGSSYYA